MTATACRRAVVATGARIEWCGRRLICRAPNELVDMEHSTNRLTNALTRGGGDGRLPNRFPRRLGLMTLKDVTAQQCGPAALRFFALEGPVATASEVERSRQCSIRPGHPRGRVTMFDRRNNLSHRWRRSSGLPGVAVFETGSTQRASVEATSHGCGVIYDLSAGLGTYPARAGSMARFRDFVRRKKQRERSKETWPRPRFGRYTGEPPTSGLGFARKARDGVKSISIARIAQPLQAQGFDEKA